MGAEITYEVGSPRLVRELAEGRSQALKTDQHPLPAVNPLGEKPTVNQPRQKRTVEQAAVNDKTVPPRGQLSNTYAKFEVEPGTHRVRIDIVDAASGEVVRHIPPWDSKAAASALDLTLAGMKAQPEEALRAHALVTPEAVQRLARD